MARDAAADNGAINGAPFFVAVHVGAGFHSVKKEHEYRWGMAVRAGMWNVRVHRCLHACADSHACRVNA